MEASMADVRVERDRAARAKGVERDRAARARSDAIFRGALVL